MTDMLSGEPLLFKSSFTPVYDFGFVGLAVNKVSHHHHLKCDNISRLAKIPKIIPKIS